MERNAQRCRIVPGRAASSVYRTVLDGEDKETSQATE